MKINLSQFYTFIVYFLHLHHHCNDPYPHSTEIGSLNEADYDKTADKLGAEARNPFDVVLF